MHCDNCGQLEAENGKLRALLDKVGMARAGTAGTLMGAESEVTNLKLENDLLKKGVENLCQRVHDLYNHKRSIQFCEEPICKINLAMLADPSATEKREVPVPIRPGCICGPEGMCDYHRMTDTTTPRKD